MCDPITVGTAAGVSASASGALVYTAATSGLFGAGGAFSLGSTLSTLGSIGGVFGALGSAATASANAKYQGQMAEYQAAVDENNAIMAERAAEYDADIIDDKRKRFVATKTARTGKSGVVIDDGSSLATTINSYEEFTAERLARLYQGETEAAASRAGAQGQLFAARNARLNAKRETTAGYINAVTQIGQGAYRAGLLA